MTSSRLIRGSSDSSAQVVAWRAPEVPNPGGPGSFRRSGENDLSRRSSNEPGSRASNRADSPGSKPAQRELADAPGSCRERFWTHWRVLLKISTTGLKAELLALVQAVVRQLVRREMHVDSEPPDRRDPGRPCSAASGGWRQWWCGLHPADADAIRERLADTQDNRAWRLETDPLLERGGCLIASPRSNIDARLEAQTGPRDCPAAGGRP